MASNYCQNQNDDFFFNRCFAQIAPPGVFTLFANYIIQWINPRQLAITAVCIMVVLPALLLSKTRKKDIQESQRRYHLIKLHVINFIHRIS